MFTLHVKSWYSESLDNDLNPLPEALGFATIYIDNKEVKINGNKEAVKIIIDLLHETCSERIYS